MMLLNIVSCYNLPKILERECAILLDYLSLDPVIFSKSRIREPAFGARLTSFVQGIVPTSSTPYVSFLAGKFSH